MKNNSRIKVMMGVLSLMFLTVAISCNRNLGIPVAVSGETATPTATKSPTPLGSTATMTSTQTSTSTATVSNTVTPLGNTYTATSTQTVTNTSTPQAPTSTSTSTNTAGNTSTATATCTMTNTTTPAPTATPHPNTDFDDFWCTNVWPSSYGLVIGGEGGTPAAAIVGTGVDTANYWNWNPIPEGNAGATYTPESASITVTFGGGSGLSLSYFYFYFKSVWPNGNTAIAGNVVPIAGTTNDLDMQCYCPTGGPVTIEYIQLYDNSGDEVQTPNINVGIPNNGQWTDVDVPMSNFSITVGGSLANLESNGVLQVQMQVTGTNTSTTVLDVGSIEFY